MLFPNQKSCLLSGGNLVSTSSLKGSFWHFDIANTHPSIPVLAIKQDIKYWGTVSGNSVTKPDIITIAFP